MPWDFMGKIFGKGWDNPDTGNFRPVPTDVSLLIHGKMRSAMHYLPGDLAFAIQHRAGNIFYKGN